MTEDQLQSILARNPSITTDDPNSSNRPLPTPEPERRTPDALDRVAQEKTGGQACPFVRFTFYRVRLLDVDARAHGAKDLLDGLEDAGLIPGDAEGQINFEAVQTKVHYRKDERTEIELILP